MTQPQSTSTAGARSILPVSRYMEIRSANGPAYSADGHTLYFLTNITGIPQVWAQRPDTPWPVQISFFADRVMAVHPNPVRPLLAISADEGGSENAQLYLADADGLNPRPITADPRFIHSFNVWSPDGRTLVYSTNRRDGRHFDIWQYDVETDEHSPILESDHTQAAVAVSPDGRYLIISRRTSNLNNDLYLMDRHDHSLRHLTPHAGDVVYESLHFAKDGQALYLLSDRDSEFTRVARLDLTSGAWTWLTADVWDAESLELSPDGRYLAYAVNEDGTSQLYIVDLTQDSPTPRRIEGVPEGVIAEITWHPGSRRIAFTLSSPLHAVEVWTVDIPDGAVQRVTYASASGVPASFFVAPELVRYRSFDGLEVPAFYYRPNAPGPYAVVVYVHGGPESQSRNSFNSVIQYFVQRGYAVFVPNVRGSSGYGRTYVHLDDVRKRMDSVADLAAGVRWLTEHGDADPKRIGVMGGSYGGFMTLAAVTHYPDLWAAGVDIVGIANLRTFIENTSPYRRHLREAEYGTIEADGEFFDQISPIHHVDKIQAPMIIIHGANDPRVPVGEAEQMVAALRARNHPVEYLRFEDEGHGVVKLANRIVAYGRIADFLDRTLGMG